MLLVHLHKVELVTAPECRVSALQVECRAGCVLWLHPTVTVAYHKTSPIMIRPLNLLSINSESIECTYILYISV